MLVPEFAACFIKLKTIVKRLGKKISARVEDLPAIIQLLIRMKGYLNGFGHLFFFKFKSFHPGFFFGPFHNVITGGPVFRQKVFKSTEFTDIDGRTFTFVVNKTFGDIKSRRHKDCEVFLKYETVKLPGSNWIS